MSSTNKPLTSVWAYCQVALTVFKYEVRDTAPQRALNDAKVALVCQVLLTPCNLNPERAPAIHSKQFHTAAKDKPKWARDMSKRAGGLMCISVLCKQSWNNNRL